MSDDIIAMVDESYDNFVASKDENHDGEPATYKLSVFLIMSGRRKPSTPGVTHSAHGVEFAWSWVSADPLNIKY